MKKKVLKKLNNKAGETLLETLCAILIIGMTFAFLCNTITTANKINKITSDEHPELNYNGASSKGSYQVFVNESKNVYANDSTRHLSRSVVVFEDSTGNYLYY